MPPITSQKMNMFRQAMFSRPRSLYAHQASNFAMMTASMLREMQAWEDRPPRGWRPSMISAQCSALAATRVCRWAHECCRFI